MTAQAQGLHALQPERRVALVVRVSTDIQARNEEGSLKTELQRLREHVRYKSEVVGESWEEVALYQLRGVSGKDSVRSVEFEQLYVDISSGRVNTVLVTSLERICRSVRDFLNFFEFLSEHDAQFVCLKQQYDTTSPQGRLFVTIMMALAQFEREQTAERTRDATLARAERGLWNGGQLLGYDLDPDRKGFLIPSPEESAVIAFAFETYLKVGSIVGVADELNRRGYRTKAFTSRREVVHAGKEFTRTAAQRLLKNPAYVGKKIIDARSERRLVDAVWPGIVNPETFERVQQLLTVNRRTNHSQAKNVRHVHILASGLLHCGRCGAQMTGRSGTGRLGKTYFYYVCKNPDCRLRVVATEVERAVVSRLGILTGDDASVATIVEIANRVLKKQRPEIEKRLHALGRSSKTLGGDADATMSGLSMATPATAGMLNQKLTSIARQQAESEVSKMICGACARRPTNESRNGLRWSAWRACRRRGRRIVSA